MPAPSVTAYILHPILCPASGPGPASLNCNPLENSTWMRTHQPTILHATPAHLQADVQALTRHAQALLDQYGTPTTRDLELLVIPTNETDLTSCWQGVRAEWFSSNEVDAVQLVWSRTDLPPALRVLTHEVGHHLRSFEADLTLYQSMKLTTHLIQETCAEALVLAVHGQDALHHTRPCSRVIHAHLHALLVKEQMGVEFSPYEEDLRDMLTATDDLYPAASSFMLRLGLPPAQLFTLPVRDFLDRILPLCADLPGADLHLEP